MPRLINLPQWFLEIDNGDIYVTLMTNKNLKNLDSTLSSSPKRYTLIAPEYTLYKDSIENVTLSNYLIIYDSSTDILIHEALK